MDVAGYDKLNAYRVWGNIARFSADFTIGGMTGQARAGLWYEISETDRHRYDRDWTLGIRTRPDRESAEGRHPGSRSEHPVLRRSSWTQYQPFLDMEFHPTDQLTVIPGIKYLHFTRDVAAPIGSKTRAPQYDSATYTPRAAYPVGEFQGHRQLVGLRPIRPRGFLIPPLKAFYVHNPQYNTIRPQTSSNYQVGTVYNVGQFHLRRRSLLRPRHRRIPVRVGCRSGRRVRERDLFQ